MRARTAARLAWALVGLSTLVAIFALVLYVVGDVTLNDVLFRQAGVGVELALTFPIVGAVIASRHPRNPLAWIFIVIGLTQGLEEVAYNYARYTFVLDPGSLPGGHAMAWLSVWMWMPGFGMLITFSLLLFPDGHLPSRHWRYIAWAAAGAMAAMLLLPLSVWRFSGPALLNNIEESQGVELAVNLFAVGLLVLGASGILSLLSLIVRYRRARGEERLQLRWFTFSAVVLVAPVVVSTYEGLPSIVNRVGSLVGLLALPSVPIAIGVAIMKYRLYDIDRLINRTLVYAAVSAVLVLVYHSGVVVVGGVLRSVTVQEGNNLVVAASTLAVAALFGPARRRIQGFVDRRFYRRKYDAAMTLEAFSASLRDEVDLESLSGELIAVVHETMQPSHVSLWLRDGGSREQLLA